jgi:hypothetical protein
MTIWKFPLEVVKEQKVSMPLGAEILSVQTQNIVPCMWAKVDPNAERVEVSILTHGTGHVVDPAVGLFLGTYQLAGGDLVFHVFERLPEVVNG